MVLLVLSVMALTLAGCGEPKLGTEDNPIVMSFVPSGDTQEIIASGDEIAQMITDKTGLVVEANVGTDFAAVREAMGAGKAHIGWLNTFNYVLANEKYGVDVGLVTERFGATTYVGQINVRADSGITSLEDLKGKVMCWVDPNSTSGYIIPRIMLAANGIDPDTDFAKTVEAGSHNNVDHPGLQRRLRRGRHLRRRPQLHRGRLSRCEGSGRRPGHHDRHPQRQRLLHQGLSRQRCESRSSTPCSRFRATRRGRGGAGQPLLHQRPGKRPTTPSTMPSAPT